MKSIWKFDIPVMDVFALWMPAGAIVRSVQTQRGKPCLWAEVNTDAPKTERRFRLFGTGHEITGNRLEYAGSFLMSGDALVFHVYEEKGR